MSLGRKLASFIWWSYPRGSLEYDIMVGVILAFIFLAPKTCFHHKPPQAHPSVVVALRTLPGPGR